MNQDFRPENLNDEFTQIAQIKELKRTYLLLLKEVLGLDPNYNLLFTNFLFRPSTQDEILRLQIYTNLLENHLTFLQEGQTTNIDIKDLEIDAIILSKLNAYERLKSEIGLEDEEGVKEIREMLIPLYKSLTLYTFYSEDTQAVTKLITEIFSTPSYNLILVFQNQILPDILLKIIQKLEIDKIDYTKNIREAVDKFIQEIQSGNLDGSVVNEIALFFEENFEKTLLRMITKKYIVDTMKMYNPSGREYISKAVYQILSVRNEVLNLKINYLKNETRETDQEIKTKINNLNAWVIKLEKQTQEATLNRSINGKFIFNPKSFNDVMVSLDNLFLKLEKIAENNDNFSTKKIGQNFYFYINGREVTLTINMTDNQSISLTRKIPGNSFKIMTSRSQRRIGSDFNPIISKAENYHISQLQSSVDPEPTITVASPNLKKIIQGEKNGENQSEIDRASTQVFEEIKNKLLEYGINIDE